MEKVLLILWVKNAAFADEYFTLTTDLLTRGDIYYFFYDAEVFYYADPAAMERIEAKVASQITE